MYHVDVRPIRNAVFITLIGAFLQSKLFHQGGSAIVRNMAQVNYADRTARITMEARVNKVRMFEATPAMISSLPDFVQAVKESRKGDITRYLGGMTCPRWSARISAMLEELQQKGSPKTPDLHWGKSEQEVGDVHRYTLSGEGVWSEDLPSSTLGSP
jgi:hypothetical protein